MMNKKSIVIVGNIQDWCYYSWQQFIDSNKTSRFISGAIPVFNNRIVSDFCYSYFSNNKNKCRPLIYWLIYRSLNIERKTDSLIVFYDWSIYAKDLDFIQYLKKNLPRAKIIYLFSNIVRISGAVKYGVIGDLKRVYDKIYAFDKEDAVQYGFDLSPLIYTRSSEYELADADYDVFYVGNAKDRLDTLHEIYKRCKVANLNCCFYINGVDSQKQIFPDIHYNELLSYREVLKYIARSKCLVDAIQGGSTAMTIKVSEAVVYDKKLITTNQAIQDEVFYHSENVMVYSGDDIVDIGSFVNSPAIPYTKSEREIFSPDTFINRIRDL